jgi:uncharacterized protein (TIGR03067 family)
MIARGATLAWLVLGTVALAVEPQVADADESKGATLDGAWEITYLTLAGVEIPIDDLRKGVRDNQIIFEFGNIKVELAEEGRQLEVPYSLDEEAQPTAIDVTGEEKEVRKGIFRLNGDKLELCIAPDAKLKRPEDFVTEGISPYIYLKLERVK